MTGWQHPHATVILRDRHIAEKAGSHVDCCEHDPCGPISTGIFMTHAAPELHPSESHLEAARSILELCFGLPIALSVAGSAVALRISSGLRFESASEMYIEMLSNEIEMYPTATFLETTIQLSLAALEAEQAKRGGSLSYTAV